MNLLPGHPLPFMVLSSWQALRRLCGRHGADIFPFPAGSSSSQGERTGNIFLRKELSRSPYDSVNTLTSHQPCFSGGHGIILSSQAEVHWPIGVKGPLIPQLRKD